MATSKPRQKRSRERVEKIMIAAADELARTADADALTTTSVAKRSGIPVATIYRYFADRSAIISALIDEETGEVDAEIGRKIAALETIRFVDLFETIMREHLEYFQSSRRAIVLWFGARSSKEVLGRIDRRYNYLASWLMNGAVKSGMVLPDPPPFGAELIVWTCDRSFEFMFRENRGNAVEHQIMDLTIEMLMRILDDYMTELGHDGISRERFAETFGPYAPPSGQVT